MTKHRGGRPRTQKKQSPTAKYYMLNRDYFGSHIKEVERNLKTDWHKIRVAGFNNIQIAPQ